MLTQQRKAHILAVLKNRGEVVAKALSQQLNLSEDTIRRDLRELAAEGLLQRVHGGALPASPALADFSGRQAIATDGKRAIGRTAAAMIRSGQVIFVDGGTTAVQLVRHLPPELEATIITHSPSIAVELVGHPGVTVEMIGGRLFKHSVVAVGASAIEAIARFRADIYFMGVTGIHPEIGLTTGDSEEAVMKRTLSRHAAETIVLASNEKLGAASSYVILPMNEVQGLIVECSTQEEAVATYRNAGLSVMVAWNAN
ncbi:DeoR/GlpR family DNA-binding transcription regulator [Phyllobacterium myrsinacearum]|uniref:DeoR/GlpR family transcriptional regulator of sugar metabolism n=1 Tax=Phyllobacterium myrsinacearum TaxID=28101 RepID=A0A839EMS9_9HYPH|nr:DeoR/GlpR family DNA-binding transcription regulator [Phyllobacterium myrsinacearum]MBA8878804.1 DeoR/GlpR family transcriptional regulator of sugar metabolism [Phyllobacterium myrsinacearum]